MGSLGAPVEDRAAFSSANRWKASEVQDKSRIHSIDRRARGHKADGTVLGTRRWMIINSTAVIAASKAASQHRDRLKRELIIGGMSIKKAGVV